MQLPNVDRYLKSKQYYQAARSIAAAGRNVPDGPVVKGLDVIVPRVSQILMLAVSDERGTEVAKIVKGDLAQYADQRSTETAVTFLNETTAIDLSPDEL